MLEEILTENIEAEIETGIALPVSDTSRKSKAKKTVKASKEPHPYTEILKFVGMASDAKGGKHSEYCSIKDGFIISTDNLVTIGHPINLTANFNPKFSTIETLLKNYPKDFVIGVQNQNLASFVVGDFTSNIPCVSDEEFEYVSPDPIWGNVDDNILKSLQMSASILANKSENVLENCVSLNTHLCTGFNGSAVMQYWHGWVLPTEALIPLDAIKTLSKSKKSLTSIGYGVKDTVSSVTFYFSDGSWLKTQVYPDTYHEYGNCFNTVDNTKLKAIPAEFYTDLHMLRKLSIDDAVFVRGNIVSNYPNNEAGSRYTIPDLSEEDVDTIHDYKLLKLTEKEDFTQYIITNDYAYFGGTHARLYAAPVPLNKVNV